ncbi:hypothetical protein NEOLEDRAFT_396964 [Neolentinus lepideus HHB14362 ss-1]|uniref:Uncharacterized protein n=1 Tax=Neolentinus lepideus HHB14362 ss-1 TaxID=1314782 RepID=A0A165S938_9AGAM|nr:hypothetical protein NEOLEDRAFT_396964 [Neolentinus lepideus HHB14362 ss-1]
MLQRYQLNSSSLLSITSGALASTRPAHSSYVAALERCAMFYFILRWDEIRKFYPNENQHHAVRTESKNDEEIRFGGLEFGCGEAIGVLQFVDYAHESVSEMRRNIQLVTILAPFETCVYDLLLGSGGSPAYLHLLCSAVWNRWKQSSISRLVVPPPSRTLVCLVRMVSRAFVS